MWEWGKDAVVLIEKGDVKMKKILVEVFNHPCTDGDVYSAPFTGETKPFMAVYNGIKKRMEKVGDVGYSTCLGCGQPVPMVVVKERGFNF